MINQIGNEKIPFIDILSSNDKLSYEIMKNKFSSQDYRYNRNRRLSTSKEIFEEIRKYCEQGNKEEDQWKRYLVCGICFYEEYLAINTSQFRYLISKSKSTINDVLSKMGYITISNKNKSSSKLFEKIPFLLINQNEFKKWSIRRLKNTEIKINEIDNQIFNIEQNYINNNNDIQSDNKTESKTEIETETETEIKIETETKTENNDEFDFLNDIGDYMDDNFYFEFECQQDILSNEIYPDSIMFQNCN